MAASYDLSGLIKFLARDQWKMRLEEVMGAHFGPAMKEFQIEYDAIVGVLGKHWDRTLWGCAFEDFLTQSFGPDGGNIVDEYIKRSGWREVPQNKAYMKALRSSVMSLYEASDIIPGKSFLARDLVRGGDPILVSEYSATQSLKQWDHIATRIVRLGDKNIISGGLLPFSMEASTRLLETFKKASNKGKDKAARLKQESHAGAAPLFTSIWLQDVLAKTIGDRKPVLYNSDGDEVVFHSVRFPLANAVTQKAVGAALDTLAALQRESATFWNWLGKAPAKRKGKRTDGLEWNVTMDDGTPVLGNIELKGRFVTLSVTSASRAKTGSALLSKALDSLVRAPLTEIQTVDQMLATRKDHEAPKSSIAPEFATKLVHEMLDKQYRMALHEPVGMIGNTAPAEAVKTEAGRKKVADWLKFLENRSAGQTNPADPMATYDFTWMWRELGIEKLRQ